jgi:magnesium transporter
MIVDSAWYRGGERCAVDLSPGLLDRMRSEEDPEKRGFVWVGLHEPDEKEMQEVATLFGLHELAVEDAMSPRQRPKVEPYSDMLFLVLKTLWYVDARDEVETGQVAIFLGEDFAVTVRQGEGVELATIRQDLEQRADLLSHGPTAVAYSICDRIVDGYEDVTGELEIDVDEVEESVFSPGRTRDSQRIYVLKREVAEARRAVHPLKLPLQRFATASYSYLHNDSAPFWRDIADHVVRVDEVIDSLDALLSTAFDAHLARISVDQNEDMRKISAWVAIAGVMTVVAGVYGMNFEHMPELGWDLGYAWALGLMAALSGGLYAIFKKSGWL